MQAVTTIVPIFAVIAVGWFIRRKGFMPKAFLEPANRLVYYVAIPAMIFRGILRTEFQNQFHPVVLTVALAIVFAVCLLSWPAARLLGLHGGTQGTFMQSSFHSNLGYMGLAVVYYYLGDEGFSRACVLVGFIMILQNLLAVLVLNLSSGATGPEGSLSAALKKSMLNPVILSALAGILLSVAGIPVPTVIFRFLDILSGMGLPTALLIIGASITLSGMKKDFGNALSAGALKLVLMPLLALWGYRTIGLPPAAWMPALILLASPTATLTYVMADANGGDQELAVSSISINTLLSAITYGVWLHVAS